MLDITTYESEEHAGINVTRFALALGRGVTPFTNRQCAATLMAKRGTNVFAIRAKEVPLEDGNAQRSKFSRKTLRALSSTNPRREGTKGHRSYQLILKAGGEMPYSIYKLQGGRPNDLQWDLDHGHVELI